MSAVIKALDLAVQQVRPFSGSVLAAIPSQEEEERERLRARISHLESELVQRDMKLAELRNEIPTTFENGRKEGEAAGLKAAQDRQAERLDLLESSLRMAQAQLTQSVAGLARLAPLLAAECLDLILGDRKYRAAMVRKALSTRLKWIEEASVLAIELSSQDFPDPEKLESLNKEIAPKHARLEAKEDLDSGGCRIVLRLGQMEVGLDQQWSVLRGELEAMSLPEAPG